MHVRLVANYHIVPLWSSARFRAAARAGRVSRRSCVATVAAAKQVPSPPPNHPLPRSRAPSGPAPPRVQLARPRPVCGWQLMSRSRRGAAATTPRRASPTAPRRRAPRSPRGWPRSRPARRPRLPRPTSRATVPPAPSLRQRQHVKCIGVCPTSGRAAYRARRASQRKTAEWQAPASPRPQCGRWQIPPRPRARPLRSHSTSSQ